MKFTKMHGAGNDFIIINAFDGQIPDDPSALALKLCARRTGIGADGLMLVAPPDKGGDFKLLFYNSDGSAGEMCGNGARCIARYGYEHGLAVETQHIETTAGLVIGERITGTEYRVRLNDPSVMDERIAEGIPCRYIELGEPGIPHAVVIKDDWDSVPTDELRTLGKKLRYSPAFPKGANVSFVRLVDKDCVRAVTYERGVEDFTLACGTGSGSIAAALTVMGLVSGHGVRVCMPGGVLTVSLTRDDRVHDIYLTGPTFTVCEGEIKEL